MSNGLKTVYRNSTTPKRKKPDYYPKTRAAVPAAKVFCPFSMMDLSAADPGLVKVIAFDGATKAETMVMFSKFRSELSRVGISPPKMPSGLEKVFVVNDWITETMPCSALEQASILLELLEFFGGAIDCCALFDSLHSASCMR
jgi:hypothetical protein